MFTRIAKAKDFDQIAELVQMSFGRFDEVLLVETLRKDRKIMYEWVAMAGENLLGHLVLSRLHSPRHCLALAPLCVARAHRRQGIGAALIQAALKRAADEDWVAVFVLGDPTYYNRFGFEVERAGAFTSSYPAEFTGVAVLNPGGFSNLTKEIEYPKAFSMI